MSTKDSYRTPRAVFDFYDHLYSFALDAAASKHNARCPSFITEEQDTHKTDWFKAAFGKTGTPFNKMHYAWMNPPYSNIGPFIETAIKWQKLGFGCVMLVMMDQSVGWFKRAIEHCQEVHLVIGFRLSFIDPITDKPANGNNKGSMLLVFHPLGLPCKQSFHYVERDELLMGVSGAMKYRDELSPYACDECTNGKRLL